METLNPETSMEPWELQLHAPRRRHGYKDVSALPDDVHAMIKAAMGPRIESLIVSHLHDHRRASWFAHGLADDWFVRVSVHRDGPRRRAMGSVQTWSIADLVSVDVDPTQDGPFEGRIVWRNAKGASTQVDVPAETAEALRRRGASFPR